MKKKLLLIIFLISAFVFSKQYVYAADISAVADKTSVSENQTFTVNIYTNTSGVNINNIESTISFPSDLLSVQSINSNSSIFSLWVEQPTFSNADGIISFSGGIPTPGYIGSHGKILSILFKAKKAGSASVVFSSANIYANDGMGTDVTSLKSGAFVTINPYKGAETNTQVMESSNLPVAPVINSVDMPDPESWYSVNSATFSWNLPKDVTAVQVLVDKKINSIPNVTYSPSINKKTVNGLSDGIRYIHVRFKNSAGWSKTSHRKIKIDNTAPSDLNVVSSITDNTVVNLSLNSKDLTSGVDKYKISVDGNFVLNAISTGNQTDVLLPPQKSGNHQVGVVVYDKAGNLKEKVITILFPEIKSPEIIKSSDIIKVGDRFEISGISYPNTNVRVWSQQDGQDSKSSIVKTLNDGSFSFTSDIASKSGRVASWSETVMSDDVISPSSNKVFTTINNQDYVQVSLFTIKALSVIIPIVLLLAVLIIIIYRVSYRLKGIKKVFIKDLTETGAETSKMLRVIKEDSKKIIRIFKNKEIKDKLTAKDISTIETLAEDIKEIEKYFEKRIRFIEKKDL